MIVEQNKENQEQIQETVPKLTPEQIEKLSLSLYVNAHKNSLMTIWQYLDRKKININEAINEVINKTSGLTRRNRELLLDTKLEILEQIFNADEID